MLAPASDPAPHARRTRLLLPKGSGVPLTRQAPTSRLEAVSGAARRRGRDSRLVCPVAGRQSGTRHWHDLSVVRARR
jgi:hypothetical protein